MIGRPDIVERVAEWQLTEEVVEKDYVLGWLLWGIGADSVLGNQWVFKGGTCLKKCYIETYRFSEDLDFTVLPGGPYQPEQIEPLLGRVLTRVHEASGIDFSSRSPLLRLRPDEMSTEGRVYYIGAHQLPALPPLQAFLDELPILFGWLEGTAEFEDLPALPAGDSKDAWSPPPTVATWRVGVPLETVRFAATNHLCVDLLYEGSWRRVEPYSLRRSSAGRLLLHAERSDGSGHRTYGIDKIGGIRATTTPFKPRYPIEFSARGPLHAQVQSRTSRARQASAGMTRSRSWSGPVYVYQCTRCGKELRHTKRDSTLRAHKDPSGYPCRGRRGMYMGARY